MAGRRATPWDAYRITESGLYLRDNTIANVSTARHGLVPKLPNDATKFLNGTGGWTVPSGGGGGGTTLYERHDPLIPDASPHSLTHDFDSNDLSAFTSIYNGDSGVVIDADTTAHNRLFMELPSQQYRMRAKMLAFPGGVTDFTIHSGIAMAAHRPDDTNVAFAGILIADGVTENAGSQTGCCISTYAGLSRVKLHWQKYGNDATGAAVSLGRAHYDAFLWLRVRRVSGTYYWAWSGDPEGLAWYEDTQAIYNGITPTHFGLFSQNYVGATAQFVFPYLRYYTTGTQLLTGAARGEVE